MNARQAVQAWREFASTLQVRWNGRRRSWAGHVQSGARGFRDEEQLVQPTVFPSFAEALLGFRVGLNLAPERHDREGQPDFTPADSVTHPFIFETKGTSEGTDLAGHEAQVTRYLRDGRPRIKRVVVTNLVGIRVFSLDERDQLKQDVAINLRGLLGGEESTAASLPDARKLAEFLEQFSYRELTPSQKIERVRQQAPWNPLIEVTDSQWISARLDRVVQLLTMDVTRMIQDGTLADEALVLPEEQESIRDELQELEWRLGSTIEQARGHTIDDYVTARAESPAGKALTQYAAHVAYYTATRLLLVRIWEDLDLLKPTLYNGGFDEAMNRFDDVVKDVVRDSFYHARDRYRALFDKRNNYTWYEPSGETYADTLYELANTYLGEVASDVLGEVYERLLERVDRKILGQYYTPRDIIGLIWDLIDMQPLADSAEQNDRTPRVLDIATGSGGFLVEAARRLRLRKESQEAEGASVASKDWIRSVAANLTGVEIQRFPAYLAELNLLIQLGQAFRGQKLPVPPLGVLPTDTLSLHDPYELIDERGEISGDLLIAREERRSQADRVRNPSAHDYLMDVACGNPPYIGENRAAPLIARTLERFPYWKQYVGHHMDYLYWFLILGISKLRAGGRFGFITTEYWLRAVGARPLRSYLAKRCRIDRILLFRDFRLFPDAPGQHSMIIVGERIVPPDSVADPEKHNPGAGKPQVSVYDGEHPRSPGHRKAVLDAMRGGRSSSGVRTFKSTVSPNDLGVNSWAEVVMSPSQMRRRRRFLGKVKMLRINPEQAMQTNADAMRRGYDAHLTVGALREIGWPDRKAGIFVLTPEEVEDLGRLTPAERAVLRVVVNTKDVHPYAAVPPKDASRMLYMTHPEFEPDDDSSKLHLPFPAGLPNIERHLEHYRSLLEHKVRGYGEDSKRPWWSIHRPKPKIAARDHGRGKWADYCVIARWGGGSKMVVGMAPKGSAPLSGIYALLTDTDIPGAYACGVLNSTTIQELAETLPPGVIRADDLESIGLPLVTDEVDSISTASYALADLVSEMVHDHSARFPLLSNALYEDIALSVLPDDSWLPAGVPRPKRGKLADVDWVEQIRTHGSQGETIQDVTVQRDLLGVILTVGGRNGSSMSIHLKDLDEDAALLLARVFRGLMAQNAKLNDVSSTLVPTKFGTLADAFESDREGLRVTIEEYRKLRTEIDEVIDAVI